MSEDNVKVIIRCRPFNQKEKLEGAHNIVHSNHDMAQVIIDPPDLEQQQAKKAKGEMMMNERIPRTFTFDAVFGEESKNMDIFLESFRPIVQSITQGYNACIFCYGQTGSGKTFTMTGVPSNIGCIPNSFQLIFDHMSKQPDTVQFLCKASYIEIYMEEVRDLVTNNQKLPVKENKQKGVYIGGLSEYMCTTEADLQKVMDDGYSNRSVAATKMNATSSRSHNIFMIRLEQAEVINGKDTIKVGCLNLVDLAGSERQSKTGSEGDRLKEAASINLSLSTLGVVIQKLVDASSHVPYRDSVLTRLLQNSLGGNSKTLMMAAINPASTNFEESMSTLRYADQAKRIKNKPKVNEDPKDAQIREMRDRIKQLEDQLKYAMENGTIPEGNQAALKQVMNSIQMMKNQQVDDVQEVEEIEEVQDPEEAEKLRILNQQKQDIQQQMQKQDESASAAKITIEEMKNQLQALKGAVVMGKELEDNNRERERLLRETRAKLAERQQRELVLKRELAKREQDIGNKQQFTSVQEEVKQLKHLINEQKNKIQIIVQDLDMIKNEHQHKVDDIENTAQDLNKQFSVNQLLIDNLLPPFEYNKILNMLRYNDETRRWEFYSKDDIKNLLCLSRDVQVVFPRNNRVSQVVHQKTSGGFIKENAQETLQMAHIEQQTVK